MAVVRGYPGQTIAPNVYSEKQSDIIVSTDAVENDELGHDDKDNYLVVSPYTEKEHLLDLRTLDKENALLAKALVEFKSLRPDYATAPYTETFNWDQVMDELTRLVREDSHVWKETSFYIVAFRSQIPPTTVYAELGVLDKAAHAEATASGTGSEHPIRKGETWPHAYGGLSRTPGKEESGQHTAKLQEQRVICTANGVSTDTD
ncbi:hypothetical protein E8E14_005250 [Neopestalotiopsis sp. 37M]|nr:hypothetical protein E8E14_005250 [Neopestalotiopsis sp. 37M]